MSDLPLLNIEQLFLQDINKFEQGANITIGPASFKIKRYGTRESDQIISKLKLIVFGQYDKVDSTGMAIVHGMWLAEYGCTGWSGLCVNGGDELEYSQSQARAIFNNPGYHTSLVQLLVNESLNYENYLYDAIDADVESVKK
jgi:hypothetical protein